MGEISPSFNAQTLTEFTREQLITLILQQQQEIAQLRDGLGHSYSQLEGSTEALSRPLLSPTKRETHHPYLEVQCESGRYQVDLVGNLYWTIGRGSDNAIVLPDQWMSRNHAMLQSMGTGELYLIDLGSHNGSFVNGRRVSVPISLKHGDKLTFGQTNVDFYNPGAVRLSTATQGLPDAPVTALLHVRRLISVLVVDIRNFTGLTRKLDERLLSEVVGTWFRKAGDIIRAHGSWVDKYIGDAVMAVWMHGTQEVSRQELQQPFHALHQLNEMTQKLHLVYPLPFPLKIGAGVNTGYGMVGNTGSGDRPDYTVLGDTVNAAFRLETSTKQIGLDIAVGATTFQHMQAWQSEDLPLRQFTVQLKGYENPKPAYACSFPELKTFLETNQ
ncbi:adenylate/guanylate cyclase domain-containing protein [Acaryochloris sp. IP29b_bin.137]|uniref:adenylate/guanylate cyclase domain-containing protein n=1 Tax=Acaryochloris sp. IP29b_bin.137 TaxID=2969217 RepID=UPI00344BD7B4